MSLITTDATTRTTFSRPRFFAGQLLTEDDLVALADYVTAKNRLHNRYLFGAGVVCGLQVACHPCGGGTLRVHPGYALDCCGNDIVVPCPEDLDVNRLIRDLRIRLLGEDCGDPCEPASNGHAENNGTGAQYEDPEPSTRHYCLYVRYDEQLAEPVAPYATEEPCGHQACEPTRVREGYKFLLKCREPDAPIDDLFGRITDCLKPLRRGGREQRIGRLIRAGHVTESAARTRNAPVVFEGDEDTTRLVGSLDRLKEQVTAEAELTDERARKMTDDLRLLASGVGKFDLQDEATQAQLIKDYEGLTRLEEARALLTDAAATLGGTAEQVWDDALDREIAAATIEQAARLGRAEALERAEALMLAQGLPWSGRAQAYLGDDEAALKEWLLDQLDKSTMLTDCELRATVAAIAVPTETTADAMSIAALGRTGRASAALLSALCRYIIDCLCSALIPPCQPCDDTDVLLACIEVRDCEVVRICNSTRDHVVSGAALAYWLPVRRLEQLIEQVCCAGRLCPQPGPNGLFADEVEAGEAAPPVAMPLVPMAFSSQDLSDPRDQLLALFAALGVEAPRFFTRPADVLSLPGDVLRQLEVVRDRLAGLSGRVSATRTQLTSEKGRLTGLRKRIEALEGRG